MKILSRESDKTLQILFLGKVAKQILPTAMANVSRSVCVSKFAETYVARQLKFRKTLAII